MVIHLPKDVENSIQALVQSGRFASIDEAVFAALRDFLDQQARMNDTTSVEPEETAFEALSQAGLIGCLKGSRQSPTDLSTNPVHMEGFGRE